MLSKHPRFFLVPFYASFPFELKTPQFFVLNITLALLGCNAAAFLPSLPRNSFMMYSRHFKELTTLKLFGCLGSFGLVKNCMQNSILHSG
jgi:hypothetical protein